MALKDKDSTHKSFGIRRRFSTESAEPSIDLFTEMYNDGQLPAGIERRDSLHVTLLPRRRLDRQLRRGIILGYEFGKAVAATKQEIQDNTQTPPYAKLGEIAVLKNRIIVHKIESVELQKEVEDTFALLGRFGLKGMMKERLPLHATLGQTTDLISQANQKYLERTLNEIMPVGDEVILKELEIYPTAS
jgi:hypothetical protein